MSRDRLTICCLLSRKNGADPETSTQGHVMFDQIAYGFKLYVRSFGILALVGLPMYIPCNLVLAYFSFGSEGSLSQIRMVSLYQSAVNAFQAGAIITTLHCRLIGKPVRLREALANAAKYWMPIIATGIVANIISGLSLLALIIPGLICLVRFSFLDLVVVLENCHGTPARQRSWDLTRDCAWWIALVACVYYPIILVIGCVPFVASEYITLSAEAWMVVEVVNGCIVDLLMPLMTAILLSFYSHAAGRMVELEDPIEDDELPEIPSEPNDDANPYRAPQST